MVLGVDVSRLVGPRTGIGRKYEYLVRSWARQEIPFERVDLFSPAPIDDLPNDARFRPRVLRSRGPGIWWETVRLGARAGELDLLLAPYSLPLAYRGRCVVDNGGILEGPDRVPGVALRARGRSWHFAHSARRADLVLAWSAVVRDDLVRWYGVPPTKIEVVPPGMDDGFRPLVSGEEEQVAAAAELVLGTRAPFLLFVGKLSVRRHIPALLEAFSLVAKQHPDLHLLLAGPNSAGVPVDELARTLGCADRIRHIEHLEHPALALLYRGALALVLPTTKEGWSVPVREALASGCPVITVEGPWLESDGAAEAVLRVSAPEPEQLGAAIGRLLLDAELRGRLREQGLATAARFPSQDEWARRVMGLLERTARRQA